MPSSLSSLALVKVTDEAETPASFRAMDLALSTPMYFELGLLVDVVVLCDVPELEAVPELPVVLSVLSVLSAVFFTASVT